MTEYLIIIEREGQAWGAFCPDLPGVGVSGRSRAAVEDLIAAAIPMHLDGLRAAGEPIPEPSATGSSVVSV